MIDGCNQGICTKEFSYRNAHNKDLATKIEIQKFTKEIFYLHEKNDRRELLSELNTNTYQKGLVVTKKEFDELSLSRKDFHGEWNYTLSPRIQAG